MKKHKRKTNKSVLAICLVLVALTTFILLQFTKMEKLENIFDLQVDLDSELAYTLSVSYDGVDRNSDKSSELLNTDGKPKIIKVESGYIYVEDILPDGLEFQKFNFVGDDDQVLGATKRDSSVAGKCNGYVVNDSGSSTDPKNNHGLHYDEETRKITFKIKNLTAGCKLDVGIITKTPKTIEGYKKDFYNTATAWEGTQMAKSNMTHAWIQTKKTSVNKVRYRLVNNPVDGTIVPPNVSAPDTQEYAPNSVVNVAFEPKVEGYTFSGWKIVDPLSLQITNGKFTMPSFENESDEVVLEGYFTELPKYEVAYRIDGDDKPSGYVLPLTSSYYANETVKVDSMNAGDVFKGYTFLGWETTDVNISSDKDFIMPSKNVEIVGRWEKIKYKVTYAFQDGVRPPNYREILNELNNKDNTYAPGEKVKLPIVEDIPATEYSNGYHFQGWYKEDNFVMPEENVIVYGEWKIVRKIFAPSISKEIINKKDYYKKGDIVEYNIIVTNSENYEIKNVIVKEHNVNAQFINNNDTYNIRSTHVVEIPSIPAKGSVIVKATYEVAENDIGTIVNMVEILGATADNNDLDTSEEAKEKYKATASFDIWPELKISKKVLNEDSTDKVFQFHITSDNGYDSWLNLTNNEEQVLYLEPDDTYYIKEVVPQEYTLESVTGDISDNGEGIEVKLGEKYSVEFTNKHHRKGYYHSDGRVSNEVKDVTNGRPDNPGGGPSYTSLTIQKVWIGDSEAERPASVSVQLYRDDEPYGSPITLNNDNKWSYTWKNLNNRNTWVVGEIDVPDGYTSSITQSGTTVTITNTYGEDIPDPDEPSAETVRIYFKVINGYFFFGENVYPSDYQESYEISIDIPLYDEEGNLNKSGKAYLTEDRIPKVAPLIGYNFKKEWDTITPVPGLEVHDGDIFVIEFLPGECLPSTGDSCEQTQNDKINVKVLWDDKGNESKRPAIFTIVLLKNEEIYDTVDLSAENKWSYNWEGLDTDYSWTITPLNYTNYNCSVIKTDNNTIILVMTYITNSDPIPPPPNE